MEENIPQNSGKNTPGEVPQNFDKISEKKGQKLKPNPPDQTNQRNPNNSNKVIINEGFEKSAKKNTISEKKPQDEEQSSRRTKNEKAPISKIISANISPDSEGRETRKNNNDSKDTIMVYKN